MSSQSSIVDLVSGYRSYATADELNVRAAIDTPATSVPCTVVTPSTIPCGGAVLASPSTPACIGAEGAVVGGLLGAAYRHSASH